jgi:hypothetical protein
VAHYLNEGVGVTVQGNQNLHSFLEKIPANAYEKGVLKAPLWFILSL